MNHINTIFEIQDLKKTFELGGSKIPVLNGINLDIERNKWLILIGQSGSGKSTLLHLLGGLDRPDSGQLICNNIDMIHCSRRQRNSLRRNTFGMVFQSFNLFPELTALENVMLPNLFKSHSRRKAEKRAKDLLEQFGLSQRLEHRPPALSGGEQQRIAIARAMVNDPEIILADEPTGNLDPESSQNIIEIFKDLKENHGKTIIMVTHDMNLTEQADVTKKIDNGLITNA